MRKLLLATVFLAIQYGGMCHAQSLIFSRNASGNSLEISTTGFEIMDSYGSDDGGAIGHGAEEMFNSEISYGDISDSGSETWEAPGSDITIETEEGSEQLPYDQYFLQFSAQLGGNSSQQADVGHAGQRSFSTQFTLNEDARECTSKFESTDVVGGSLTANVTGGGQVWVDIEITANWVAAGEGTEGADAEYLMLGGTVAVYKNGGLVGVLTGNFWEMSYQGQDSSGTDVSGTLDAGSEASGAVTFSNVMGVWVKNGDVITYQVTVARTWQATCDSGDGDAAGTDSWTFNLNGS